MSQRMYARIYREATSLDVSMTAAISAAAEGMAGDC